MFQRQRNWLANRTFNPKVNRPKAHLRRLKVTQNKRNRIPVYVDVIFAIGKELLSCH